MVNSPLRQLLSRLFSVVVKKVVKEGWTKQRKLQNRKKYSKDDTWWRKGGWRELWITFQMREREREVQSWTFLIQWTKTMGDVMARFSFV